MEPPHPPQSTTLQCILIKNNLRCTNTSTDFYYGITVPILDPNPNPAFRVYICGQCIDEMYYIAHESERQAMGGLI